MASIFDTEEIYPNDDFWLEEGFNDIKKVRTMDCSLF